MQRIDELPVYFFELPSVILVSKVLSSLDPKFVSSLLPQINKQFSTLNLDASYWQSKIEKHFPGHVGTGPFNKSTFKKIEAAQYPNFSGPEKELVRLMKEEDIESLEKLPITLEMLDHKDPSGTSILTMAHQINNSRLLASLNKKGFEAANINFTKENGELDHQRKDAMGRTILYWGFVFEQDVETLIQLMKQGSFTELYFNDFQPFHLAIKLGRLDFLKVIFNDEMFRDSLGSLLEQRDASEQTPLILAAKHKETEIASFLLAAQANPRAVTGFLSGQVNMQAVMGLIKYGDYGKTAFHWAVQLGNLEMVKDFIEKIPALLDEIDIFGETPLIWAVRARHTQMVKFLLDKGAKLDVQINRRNHRLNGKKAFHFAVKSGDLEMIQVFIEKFPHLLREDIFGEAPLIVTVILNQLKVVKYLLDKGANPNVQTDKPHHEDDKKSPLYWAVVNGNKEMVELLIRSGAMDLNEYGQEKMRVIHLATKKGQLEIIKMLRQHLPDLNYIAERHYSIELARDYIKKLPTLCDQKNGHGETPLHLAAARGQHDIVKFLLDNKADPNTKINRPHSEHQGEGPLQLAYEGGYVRTVALLVKHGADTNIQIPGTTMTFVMRSARIGDFEMLKALIENAPDPLKLLEQKDKFGQTALLWAAVNGQARMVQYLLSKGANTNVKSVAWQAAPGSDLAMYHGKTPLDWAFEHRHLDVVALLFKADYKKLNVPTHKSSMLSVKIQLMDFAVHQNDFELIKLLLEDDKHKNKLLNPKYNPVLFNPLLIAIKKNYLVIAEYLLSQGANLNRIMDDDELSLFRGETPLYWAYENDNADLVALLVKHGADPILPGKKSGFSPLQLATRDGHLEMMKTMIENIETDNKKFVLDQAHTKNITLLMIAVEKGRIDIVKYLLEQGADPYTNSATLYSSQIMAPLALALERNKVKIVDLLLSTMKHKFLDDRQKLKKVLFIVSRMKICDVLTKEEFIKFDQQLQIIDDQNSLTDIKKTNTKKNKITKLTVDDETNLEEIISSLQKANTVSLKFERVSIKVLAQCFSIITPYVDQIIHLEFSDCSLTHDLMEDIAHFIGSPKSALTSLQFTNVLCDWINIGVLSDALLNHSSLKELYFSNCQIRGQGARILADMLLVNQTLLSLYLPRNQIGDQGASCFAYALAHGARISSLGLSKNNIGLEGAQELERGLCLNTALQKLILFRNRVSLATQLTIDRYLARNSRLNSGTRQTHSSLLGALSNFSLFTSHRGVRTVVRTLQNEEDRHGHNAMKDPSPSRFKL